MELYIGKKFKFELWEEWIQDMRVEEISQIDLNWSLCSSVYPLLSKSYRNFANPSNKQSEAARQATHCCGLQAKTGYGYKDLDQLVESPPAQLRFTLELIQVEYPETVDKELWIMNESEMTESVPALRAEGNTLFSERKYQEASFKYRKALAILEQLLLREKPGDDEWNKLDRMKIPLLSNLSQCELYLEQYYQAIEHTTEVLAKDSENVKALFRRAKAHSAVWNVEQSKADFVKVIQLDPTLLTSVNILLKQLDQRIRDRNAQDTDRLKGKLFS